MRAPSRRPSFSLFICHCHEFPIINDKQGSSRNHNKCKGSKITHLCFADDLLIFTDGSLRSVQNIMSILGLPLYPKKLSATDCAPLLLKIQHRITSWAAKSLSYAGRLQLINSVLAGITGFWCSTFPLPKSCVRQINSLLGHFLWKGSLDGHHTARISWDQVNVSPTCLLCGFAVESRNHIYFECSYSWALWSRLCHRLRFSPSQLWSNFFSHIQNTNLGKIKRRLIILTWQTTIYEIWTERNSRLHRDLARPIDCLLAQIDSVIRCRVSSLRHQNPTVASQLLQSWFDSPPLSN